MRFSLLSLAFIALSTFGSLVSTKLVEQEKKCDQLAFVQEPLGPPKCYRNGDVINLTLNVYLHGTTVIDTSVGTAPGQQIFDIQWSDKPDIQPTGAAYFVNALDPSQTSQANFVIQAEVVKGVAKWSLYVVNGTPGKFYQWQIGQLNTDVFCNSPYTTKFRICDSGGFADPQFTGLQGQPYQVHGRPDTVFNLISYPSKGFALTSEFVYLAEGKCDYNNTACWTHPGTYFGKMGILIDNSTHVLVNSGPHNRGLQVYINDKRSQPSDNPDIFGSSSVHVVAYDRVEIRTPDFFIALVNSDMFLNMDLSLLDKELLSAGTKDPDSVKSDLHGLLGQTWKLKDYTTSTGIKRPYQGNTDDYVVDTPYDYM